jgi:hypothetical protein
MNANTQKLLSGMAKSAGLTVEFPDNAPIRISGFQDGDCPLVLISTDQPDSELIFAILQNIGFALVPDHTFWPRHFPWYLNRIYEYEFAGDVVYKARRAMRRICNREWRARLWALCTYGWMNRPAEFQDFMKRHPEKWNLIPLVAIGMLSSLPGVFVRYFINILGCGLNS